MSIQSLRQRWEEFSKIKEVALTLNVFRYALMAGILAFLFIQIKEIGWKEIVNSLPTTPWFYLIFFILYFALPISEQFIYSLSLDLDFRKSLVIFMKKKILNAEVLGYTGEAYFFIWAKKNLKEEAKYIFQVIKDNNIISSFASTLMAVILLSVFLYIGQVNFMDIIGAKISKNFLLGIAIFVVIALVLAMRYRKQIISMNMDVAMKVFSIHTFRIILVYSLEMLMWWTVLPDVPFHIWSVFLAMKIIASRLPFIPSQDLIFVSLSVGMTRLLDANASAIAGVLLASAALTKLTSFILYLLITAKKSIGDTLPNEAVEEYLEQKQN